MSVKLGPRGTRGSNRSMSGPSVGLISRIMIGIARLSGATRKGESLLLTTTGARTGQPRTAVINAFRDGDAWLIAGSMGGSARHPAWARNLAKQPEAEIEIEGRQLHVRAESLHGEERDRGWERIKAESPMYAGYEQKTDREIPVLRLTPIS